MNKYKSAAISLVILLVAVFIAAVFIKSGQKKNENSSKKTVSEKSVKVKNVLYKKTITSSGRMFAFNKFDIYAEVNGLIKRASKPLRAGTFYKKGETIIKIDASVFKNQLKAKRSALLNQITLLLPDLKYDFPNEYEKWLGYLGEMDATKTVPPLPKISSNREKYYLASKNILQSYYDIKSMEATFEKYSIKAPYNGYLTAAYAREGDMARAGQKLGTFVNSGLYEMAAAVSASDLKYLKKGMDVTLSAYKSDKKIKGKIVRINPSVSPETQSVYVYVQTKDPSVRDGMFYDFYKIVQTDIMAAKIPKAAFDEEEFVVIKTDNGRKRIKPHIVDKNPLFYFITDIPDGTEIVYESN
jgi:multidrug efflux pump subunit AcrA (membrane-fusion protein)